MTTLTTLASFTGGLDGGDPGYGALIADANGDLFGATLAGGATGDGTVFELVNTGSGYTLQTLASLTYNTTGSAIFAGLTMDAQGDLYGVAQQGGPAGDGTVFELVNTGSGYSLQTLMSFSGSNGFSPTGALVADANGDLFGTTQAGGANSQGTVFELVKGASGYTFQTVVDFDFTNGSEPAGPLIADAHGDLFGTTLQGGPGGSGTVFELVDTGSGYTVQTLASFNGANGSSLYAGLAMDAQGDLFGTTYGGGPGGYGTVFELVSTGSGYAFQTLATLDYGASGAFAIAGLTLDANGDLYGAAMAGGAGGFGTVFELVKSGSSYSLQVLYAFSGPDGGFPEGTPILDSHGDLIGTTAGGGADGYGTVFELAVGAPTSPSTPADDDSGEHAALALTVNGGSSAPIGAAGASHVAFTVAGMDSEDTGVVVFTDQANHAVLAPVSAGQTSYVADLSSLTDGAIKASLQVAADPAGNSFAPVAGNGVTLDTIAPDAPTGLADAAIWNGYVNKVHDTAGQSLTGTAEAGSVVTVYDNGVKLGSNTADASTGAWSFGLGALGEGSQSLTATATDAAGNTGAASAALTFVVDTIAPVPAVANVTDAGKGLSTVSGTSEAGSQVTLFDSGQKVGVATTAAGGTWSVTLKLNGGQAHVFTETAVDLAGNTGASAGAAYWANPANRSFSGGQGDDVFVGQKGDSFTSGPGRDHFVFNTGFGSETVAGFRSGSDQIWFDHTLFANAAAVLAHAHLSGGSTVIVDGLGDQLLLQGVLPSQLQAGDFHLF